MPIYAPHHLDTTIGLISLAYGGDDVGPSICPVLDFQSGHALEFPLIVRDQDQLGGPGMGGNPQDALFPITRPQASSSARRAP